MLAQAPWSVTYVREKESWWIFSNGFPVGISAASKEIGESICKWRNAEEVMERRGWTATRTDDGKKWFVSEVFRLIFQHPDVSDLYFDDPLTALIEADKWLREKEGEK